MEVPQGQIDHGKGTIACSKCGKLNYKGTIMCGWGSCNTMFNPSTFIIKSETETPRRNVIDLSKLGSQDLEARAITSKTEEGVIKRAGFERRIDRLNNSIKNARSEGEVQKYQRLKNQSINIYRKYS